MTRPRTDPGPADDHLRDLPYVPGGAWGPVGEIAQAEKFAMGLRQARSGWRKVVFRAGVAFFALVAVGPATVGIYVRLQ